MNGFRHLYDLIGDFLRYGDYDSANSLSLRAIPAAQTFNDLLAEATAQSIQASILYKQGNPSKAENIALQALKLMCKGRDLVGVARVTFILAQISYSKSDFKNAIRLFEKSIQLYARTHDTNSVLQGMSELSAVYVAIGQYPRARKILDFLLRQRRRLSEKEMTFITYDYADLSIMTGDLETATRMTLECRRLSRKLGFRPMEAAALALQGKVEEFAGTPHIAIELMNESIAIQDSIKNKEILLDVLCHLGHLYISMSEFEKAKASLIRAREVAEEDGHENLIAQCDLYDIEYRLQKRDLDGLDLLLDTVAEKVSTLDDPTMMNLIQLNRIEFLVLNEEYIEAEEDIETLISNARAENAKLTELQVLVVKAALETKLGAFDTASIILDECLNESSQRGLTHFFLDASRLKERVLVLKSTTSIYDQADRIKDEDETKQELTSEEIAAYISRAKSVIASLES
ncbi:MAG: tetratricopeptide repeat protein [Candidatus Thorarchaeota archaeon]